MASFPGTWSWNWCISCSISPWLLCLTKQLKSFAPSLQSLALALFFSFLSLISVTYCPTLIINSHQGLHLPKVIGIHLLNFMVFPTSSLMPKAIYIIVYPNLVSLWLLLFWQRTHTLPKTPSANYLTFLPHYPVKNWLFKIFPLCMSAHMLSCLSSV